MLGLAIVEQEDSTVVIYPGHQGRLNWAGNLIVTYGERCNVGGSTSKVR
jgi:hypothetical protein